MTKYAIQVTCETYNITRLITNYFTNRTAALQILELKRLRAIRRAAIMTEQGDGFFSYKTGGLEFKLEVVKL